MGDETRWPARAVLLEGAGVPWSGLVFFRAGREGLAGDDTARSRLAALMARLIEDRLLIRDGAFFNRDDLQLALEEVKRH